MAMHSDPRLRSWSRIFPWPLTYRTSFVGDIAIPMDGVNLFSDLRSARILTNFLTAIHQSFHHVIYCRSRESCLRLKDGNDPSMNWLRFVKPFIHPARNRLSERSTLPRNGCNTHIPRSIIWYLFYMKD